MALQEFLVNLFALVCEDLLDTRYRFQKSRSGQNLEAELHPLGVVHVN